MKKVRKISVICLCVVCLLMITSISIFAVSEVRCVGGGASNVDATHRFGLFWFYSHSYTYSYHDVDRVYSGVVYKVYGHYQVTNCGENDFSDPVCPVGTIVGYG